MKSVQQEVDERSNLTGTNKFELLLFRLGGDEHGERNELFGINVFKIREIVAMPEITAVAGSPAHVLGVVNLRGQIIQVLDLPAIAGVKPKTGLNIMLVTEFARTTQAFAVESVEEIVRLDWSQVMSAEEQRRQRHGHQHRAPRRRGRRTRRAWPRCSTSRPSCASMNPDTGLKSAQQTVGAKIQHQARFRHPGRRRLGRRARPDRAGAGRDGPAVHHDQERQGSAGTS